MSNDLTLEQQSILDQTQTQVDSYKDLIKDSILSIDDSAVAGFSQFAQASTELGASVREYQHMGAGRLHSPICGKVFSAQGAIEFTEGIYLPKKNAHAIIDGLVILRL